MLQTHPIAIVLAALAGTGNSAVLECGPESVDFGTVPQGKTVTLDRVCQNTSSREIQIQPISTGCTCLSAKLDRKTIAPGAKARLRLEMETTPLADRVEFAVEIPYHGKEPASELLNVSADVRPSVVAFPEYLDLGDFRKGGPRQILVVDTTGRPFGIRQSSTARSELEVHWTPVELVRMGNRWQPATQGGAVTGYQLTVQVRQGSTRRSLSDEIQLDLVHDLQKSLRIRVVGFSP